MNKFFLVSFTLWKRELVRFYRQPSRVVGALASPLMFWLLLGSGIGTSFRSGGALAGNGYLGYFFPGTLLLTVFFTAVFSTISIIEDRREGFLQTVLVAPVPRLGIVFGKILGGASLAFIQAILFLFLAPFAGIHLGLALIVKAGAAIFLSGFLLTTLGFIMAWQFQSIQGYHAVMNLFLMPMWILSGALFPPEGAAPWIRIVMRLNPLSYGYDSLRLALDPAHSGDFSLYGKSMLLTAVFALLCFFFAGWTARKNQVRDLK